MNNLLFKISENQLTSLNGEVSSFLQIIPPDMEGLDEQEQDSIFMELENDLINSSGSFKIYSISNKFYLNAFSNIDLGLSKLIHTNNPLEVFTSFNHGQINFYENYLTQGDEYIRILSFKELPNQLSKFDVGSWPDFVVSFKKIDKVAAKNKIQFKRKIHFASLFKGLRDIDSENAYHQSEQLYNEVTTDTKGLFEVEVFLVIRAETKVQLDNITKETIHEFKGKNASLIIEERGLSYFYQSLIPGITPSFKRKLEVPSDYLSYLIPNHSDFIFENGIKLKSRTNHNLFMDLFHQSALNFNALITGSSGQGKSMMANKILKYEIENRTKAMVLDLGNSFYKNARFHDGILMSLKFNPLQFKNVRYLKEFILAVMDESLGKKEEGKLFETIENILNEVDNLTMLCFINKLEKEFVGISYYFKELIEFFDDEIKPLNKLSYCDFSLYPESLKAPLIIYLIEYFKNLSGRKIFIFDECWHLMNKNADYVAECFRTFRKHQASAIAISQNLDDFSETQLGRVIIQNTYFKFLFKQSLSESEFIDSHTSSLLDSIMSKKGEYSEFLLLTESVKKPVRFDPTPLEYNLFTSDRADLNEFEFYMNEKGRFISFKEALVNFTKIKNPHWENYEN